MTLQIDRKCNWGRWLLLLSAILPSLAVAHGVDEGTQQFLSNNEGMAILPFMYIGAKHMVTGYDHLLFLIGVIFFLYRPKDVLIYVSFFTLGHSLTLVMGVYPVSYTHLTLPTILRV